MSTNNLPDATDRPAAMALVRNCPESMWPTVRAFMAAEVDAPAAERFAAACALARDAADDSDEWAAWMLVAACLEESHQMTA